MEPNATIPTWNDRRRYWSRKLRRLRLESEPIAEQLARYHRATWMLSAVALGLALIFVGLFTAFERPDIGLIVAGVLLGPVVAVAWLDDFQLRRRAAGYLREREEYEGRDAGQ